MNRKEVFLAKIPNDLQEKAKALLSILERAHSVVIAYSGGIDSTFLAATAKAALGTRAITATGISNALPQRDLEVARRQARFINIWHIEVKTLEGTNPDYSANGPDRCYHCKKELFKRLRSLADELEVGVIAEGSNVDDLKDYRPGRRAAAEQNVISPLAEAGFTKADIRCAAQALGLENHNKPASPCLSSRFPYGKEITADGLAAVEAAEKAIFELGFSDCRVRNYGDTARVELPSDELSAAQIPNVRKSLINAVVTAGFQHVEIDPQGLRSGNLNKILSATQ